MDPKIFQMLETLSEKLKHENSHEDEIPHEERMLAITPETGEFFNLLLKAWTCKTILEIGTSYGYSTLWFADAIIENAGRITTIEKSQFKIKTATDNFDKAGITNFVDIKCGDALEILVELKNEVMSNQRQKFDFIFLDADKENSIQYFDLVLPITKVGGIIATDNMLFPERFREEMSKFSEHVKTYSNVQSITAPIGNGEEITLKISD